LNPVGFHSAFGLVFLEGETGHPGVSSGGHWQWGVWFLLDSLQRSSALLG
jgi:hypothetical protein